MTESKQGLDELRVAVNGIVPAVGEAPSARGPYYNYDAMQVILDREAPKTIGQLIAAERVRERMTQDQLAARISRSRSYIAQIERNLKHVTDGLWEDLVTVFPRLDKVDVESRWATNARIVELAIAAKP